jgi:3-phosphoshikimate 1-carboxyvinyltransferase
MISIHRVRGSLTGEFTLNPDREMAAQALVLALLVRGRTVLEDFATTPAVEQFAVCLEALGLKREVRSTQWILEGAGFQYRTPAEWEGRLPTHNALLLLTLLSKDSDTSFAWRCPDGDAARELKAILQTYFQVEWQESGETLLQWRFQTGWPLVRPTPSGDIPYLMRNRMLLGKLVHDAEWSCEEKVQIRDQWSRMLAYFGVPIVLEATGTEEMDELARRMARAQGLKIERKFLTSLQTVKVLTAHDYFVPGDPTEAAALALAATLTPSSNIQIRNVSLNGGRAGFFAALKRLGANVDITSRRERYGDLFGNITVQTAKKLNGRRLAADVLANGLEEIPFLAVAACFSEGETILRVPEHQAIATHQQFEWLAENLRQTGAEVGVYEEGLVLRGRDECDSGAFDCHGDPVLALALLVLSRHASGVSTLEGLECTEHFFPGLASRLLQGTEV